MQINPRFRFHACAHFFAQCFDIGTCRVTGVDHKIGVFFGNLRASDLQSATARFINQLPRFVTIGIFKGRTTGFGTQRLRRFAGSGNTIHFGLDDVGLAGFPFKARGNDNGALGQFAMAITVMQIIGR